MRIVFSNPCEWQRQLVATIDILQDRGFSEGLLESFERQFLKAIERPNLIAVYVFTSIAEVRRDTREAPKEVKQQLKVYRRQNLKQVLRRGFYIAYVADPAPAHLSRRWPCTSAA